MVLGLCPLKLVIEKLLWKLIDQFMEKEVNSIFYFMLSDLNSPESRYDSSRRPKYAKL